MERLTKPKRRPTSKRPGRALTRREHSALMTGLSLEAYNVITDAVRAMGASPKEQGEALRLALKGKRRLRPSQTVLKNELAISLIVETWRRDALYTQSDGAPKVLAVRGKGATLESLVKRFAPQLSLDAAVDMLCTQCEVRSIKGDKIALVGDPVHFMKKTPATSLAWMIGQVRRLAGTCVFNAAIPIHKRGTGRFERRVSGALNPAQYAVWSQQVRQQLQETSDRVEKGLGPQDPKRLTGNEKVCGIGLFIFVDDDELG
jgi:hypothetical protein